MIATTDESWVVCWETDADGRLERIDPVWREIAGHSSGDSLDKGWLGAIHEDDRVRFLAALRQAGVEQGPFRFECRLKSGNRVSDRVLAFAAPRFGAGRAFLGHRGTLAGVVAECAPTSQPTQAEAALRASEARYRSLVAAASAVTWSCPPSGLPTEPQPEWMAFTGQGGADMLGDGWTRAPFRLELRVPLPDGPIRWVESNAELKDREAKPRLIGLVQDITDRKRAEEALREGEERLRLALDAAHFATWDWRIDTDQSVWNDTHFRMLGYEPGAVRPSYRAWAARVHPDDLPELEAKMKASIAAGRDYSAQFRLLQPDGSIRCVEAFGRFERNPEGRAVRSYGVMQDITERKQAEEKLRRSEERLRRVLETDAVGVLLFDREGYLVDANDVFLRTTGYTRHDIESRVLHWRGMTPPEYLADASMQMARFASTGRIGPYEKEYFLRDGSRRWMLFAGQDLGDGCIVEYCVDISRRKAAEAALHEADARYRVMADTAPVLIWETDGSGVTFVNGHYLDFFGVGFEEIAGMGWTRFLHPEDRTAYLEAYRQACETRSFYTFDCRFRRADGEYRWLRNSGRPLNEHKFVSCSIDISELKDAEEVLRESDRRKDEFIATLAHELRNPLAPIRSAAQILKKKHGPDAKDAALFDMVERQTKHLVRLIDDLLEISRISRGKIVLRKERVEVAAVLHDALEACGPLIDSKGHHLTASIPAGTLSVSGDPVRLVQIVTNLINNAAKYTLPGGVIEIDVAREGAKAVFRVRDNGVGIDPKIIPNIFEVFAQTDAQSRLSEGGLGIGLAVVSKLVALHGGSIAAHSDGPGTGSEFSVRLPLLVDASSAVAKASGALQ